MIGAGFRSGGPRRSDALSLEESVCYVVFRICLRTGYF